VVVQVMPVYAQAAVMKAVTGVPKHILYRLANEHRVRARKSDAARNGVCLFRVQDVVDWLNDEAAPAGPFKVTGAGEKGSGHES
jgi:hypothetical protein